MPADAQELSTFRPETPAYMSGPLKTARDFLWLLRGELFLLRESWYWYFVHSSFVSVSYFLFLWLLMGRQGQVDVTHLVVGSLVTGLSLGGMLSLGQHLGLLKELNAFDYYAALPISKAAFVAAVTTRGTLLALPSNVVVAVLATLFFDVSLPPATIPILLLSAYAMAGFGAVIGFWSPSAQVASLADANSANRHRLLRPRLLPRRGPARVPADDRLPLAHHPRGHRHLVRPSWGRRRGVPVGRSSRGVLPGVAGAGPNEAGLAREEVRLHRHGREQITSRQVM